MQSRTSLAIGVLGVFTAISQAQNRVQTNWLNPVDGSFVDAANWSMGLPDNTASNKFDAFIDAVGAPYVVSFDPDNSGQTLYTVQSLTLNSPDATLSLLNQDSGTILVRDYIDFSAGTMILGRASLVGGSAGSVMFLSPESNFVIDPSEQRATIRGFQIFGADLVVNGAGVFTFFGSHLFNGSLVFNSSSLTSNLGFTETIDFDVQLNNTSDRSMHMGTPVDNLVISQSSTISGQAFTLESSNGYFVDNRGPGSLVNYGTIRSDAGVSSITKTQNFGTVQAAGGTLSWFGSNDGNMIVDGGAKLILSVSDNGGIVDFNNIGSIVVDGPDAVLEVSYNFSSPSENNELWSNTGQITLSNGAKARLSSLGLSGVGTIIRDESSSIEIIGNLNLEGGFADQSTFGGPIVVRGPLDTFTHLAGKVTNGTIDTQGNWFGFEGNFGSMADIIFVGGDLLITPPAQTPGPNPSVRIQAKNIQVPDGDIVLDDGVWMSMTDVTFTGGELRLDEDVRTVDRSGTQSVLGIAGGGLELILGPQSSVTGSIRIGSGSYTTRRLRNEGLIYSIFLSGALNVDAPLENLGTLRSYHNDITTQDIINSGTIDAWFGDIRCGQLVNSGDLLLKLYGKLTSTSIVQLAESSFVQIAVADNSNSFITANIGAVLDGELELDLDLVTQPGVFQLIASPSIKGRFAQVRVLGLREGLFFNGIKPDGSFEIFERKMAPRGPIAW